MYDISMASKDQVLALINLEANLSLTWEQVEFGVPVVASGETPERNTELTITGIPNHGYKGTATIYYDRIDLEEFKNVTEKELILQIDGAPTLEKIRDSFNTFFGSALSAEDLADDHVVPVEADIQDGYLFTLKAAAWSYAYRGDIEITIRPLDVDINLAITDKMMNGLVLNTPAEEPA